MRIQIVSPCGHPRTVRIEAAYNPSEPDSVLALLTVPLMLVIDPCQQEGCDGFDATGLWPALA